MKRRSLVSAALLVLALTSAVSTSPAHAAAETAPVPDKAFGAAKAFEYARQSGKPVEITSQTTPTRKALANPDGQTTVQIHGAPVRMHRDGAWIDLDMTLQAAPDGSVRPRVHPHDLVLAGETAGSDSHDLATVTIDGERVGLRWRGRLPAPVLDGAKATYPDVAPGIDLVIEARTGGFEQFLVLRSRAAIGGLAALHLTVNPGRGRFDASERVWRDRSGKVVAHMPPAVMWDAQSLRPDGERRRQTQVQVRDSVISADLDWLRDPATQYPVTIDPGLDRSTQTNFDEFVQNTISNSDNQSVNELKLGRSDDSTCLAITSPAGCKARSYLRFDGLDDYAGALLTDADLHLWAKHSWSCTAYGWRASRTGSVSGSVQWGSQPAWLELGPVTTVTRGYSSSCADSWVTTDVKPLLEDVIAGGQNSLNLVIHADGDNSQSTGSFPNMSHNSWKKFDSAQGTNKPYLTFTFNHLPTLSNVTLEFDSACGSGSLGRKYLTTTTPTFRATVNDVNGGDNHVRIEVEVTPAGATAQTRQSANSAPGSTPAYTWSGLDQTKVHTYRVRPLDVRASDGVIMNYGSWSPTCEFAFDTNSIVHPPIVEGIPSEVIEGETYYLLPYGEPVQLTFRPQPVDVGKIAAYRFGFDQTTVMTENAPTVLARPQDGGAATAIVTNWQADGDGVPLSAGLTFYVRAVSVTGAYSSQFGNDDIYNLNFEPPVIDPEVGDFGGDGDADLMAIQPLTTGKDLLYLRHGNSDGTLTTPTQLLLNPAGTQQYGQGDFNGDGKSEFVSLADRGSNNIEVLAIRSDGNTLKSTAVWSSAVAGQGGAWPYGSVKLATGDVTGDGLDDLVAALGSGTTSYQLKVFPAQTTPTAAIAFANPVNWLGSPQAGNVANLKLVVGEFDGTAGLDIGAFEKTAACGTRLVFHHNVGQTSFAAAAQTWSSTGWCWDDSAFVAGDFDAVTGRTGIVATAFNRNLSGCHTDVYTFTSPYAGFVTQWNSGNPNANWCADRVQPYLRDIAGDDRQDLVVVYRDDNYQQRVWRFETNGAPGGPDTFANPVLVIQGGVGPVGTAP